MKTKKTPVKMPATSKKKSNSSSIKARTASLKKMVPAKISTKTTSTKPTSIPAAREQRLAAEALDLVDKAASLLRNGIREGAATTAQSHIAAKKKAHELLNRASNNLSMALNEGTAVLQNLIRKI